jgi:hypothetical protein
MTPEILSDAVNTIDLLQSIYFDKEFEFQAATDEKAYQKLQKYWESDIWPASFSDLPQQLEFTIKAPIETPHNEKHEDIPTAYLTFNGRISLISKTEYSLTLPSSANHWLSREDHEALVHALNNETIIDPADDRSTWIIEKMQQLQQTAEPYACNWIQKIQEDAEKVKSIAEGGPVRFLRDWIWFPMIYTREKVKYTCFVSS